MFYIDQIIVFVICDLGDDAIWIKKNLPVIAVKSLPDDLALRIDLGVQVIVLVISDLGDKSHNDVVHKLLWIKKNLPVIAVKSLPDKISSVVKTSSLCIGYQNTKKDHR